MKTISLLTGLIPATITVFAPVNAIRAQESKIQEKRPNIIWISAEDLSPRLGCYGDKLAKTPNIDNLAKQGVKYTSVFTTAAICAPCRSGIITGMYQTSIGCMHMRTTSYRRSVDNPIEFTAVPQHYVKAFTENLRAAGYYCTNNAKTDYQFAQDPVPESIWDDCGKTAHYKNRIDKNQPFFSVFNFEITHESKNWDLTAVKTDPKKVVVPPYYPDNDLVRLNIAKFYDNIAKLDEKVGQLLDELEKTGQVENTIVFFWGDHGDGLPRSKRWLYDSGLKIPLIIKWPGMLKQGIENNDLISSIDFGPTVLSMAGVPIPSHMQGRAFAGNQKSEPRNYVYAARDRVDESYDMIRSVRSKDYLYVRNFYPNVSYNIWVPYLNKMPIMKEMHRLKAEGKLTENQRGWMADVRQPEELYDVKADPFQLNNLATKPEFRSKLIEFRELQDKWTLETKDLGHLSEPEMIEQMWPGGIQPTTDAPYFVVNSAEDRASENSRQGKIISSPAQISLYCPTHGASLVYSLNSGDKPVWKLYTGAINLKKGETTVKAKAVRYGYNESEVVTAKYVVK